jgi:hypothetical protein
MSRSAAIAQASLLRVTLLSGAISGTSNLLVFAVYADRAGGPKIEPTLPSSGTA